MLNMDEINSTIEELENGKTTFEVCNKLASLYIVRDYIHSDSTSSENKVVTELKDILPQYREYCKIKRRYQLNEVTEQAVYLSMEQLCTEIKEFLHILYSNTDTSKEREMLRKLINQVKEAF